MTLVALAQIDCTLGDVAANLETARRSVEEAAGLGAEVVVFPELTLNGYALGQLEADTSVAAEDPRLTGLATAGPDVLVGFHEDGGARRYNSAAYVTSRGLGHLHRKLYLPNYLAWEEAKHSSPGQSLSAFGTRLGRAAILICNDAWQSPLSWLAAQDGAEVILVPANSAAGVGPESLDVIDYWTDLLRFIARMQQCWVVFCNRVGTEAGVRFWGGSRVLDPGGEVVVEAPRFEPALVLAEVDTGAARRARHEVPLLATARLGLLEREIRRLIEAGGDA